jgi:tRNA (cmo5U34)-methyltransferase
VSVGEQYHFDPSTYLDMVTAEVPAYARLQDEVAAATAGLDRPVRRVLDLGTGTGETARRVLAAHPGAELVGVDESAGMLGAARDVLSGATVELRVSRLEDPLPDGPFDVVVSALAVHHLAGSAKADLFARIAAVLPRGGRFVLADVIAPEDPADVVTPIDGHFDKPSPVADQLDWLARAGFAPRLVWAERDLAVIAADR